MESKRFHYHSLEIIVDSLVYEPSEDTFLMLENLSCTATDRILELGTGCGIIALTCALHSAHVVATDINPHAISIAYQNYMQNKHNLRADVQLLRGNLFSMIKPQPLFDKILFNPPYLPTRESERLPGWINTAFDGGESGLGIISQFLQPLPHYLTKRGQGYFIASSLSNITQLRKSFDKCAVSGSIISQQRFNDETLYLYRVTRLNG
ncbi:MAG: methyltransferase [Candidatus Thermoplasmatota archaeon]|nr:methyltransferase [Candidatus Thermoplasmatota archaeon]MBU1940950.1 methyltransferase [Candidatus Thermoplasmatota archaeon]